MTLGPFGVRVVSTMNRDTADEVARLGVALAQDPTSEELRERLLEVLSVDTDAYNHPRRFDLIGWFVKNNPRHSVCSTPFAHVDARAAPAAYRDLKNDWLAEVTRTPDDPQLARGAALFFAAESPDEAEGLLRAAIERRPNDPELWLALGRVARDPAERLAAFEHARAAGETLPNLLVWIALNAFRAGQDAKADAASHELMELVDEARAQFGDRLDWPEEGRAFWRRARETTSSDEEARELTDAIAQHAYRKHWGHTVLGLLAARRGDLDAAVTHLLGSANIRPDYRLSSYGPSLDLVREICTRGRWEDGLEYLHRWEKIWNDPRVGEWIAALNERRLPGADAE